MTLRFYTCSLDDYGKDCERKNTCKRYIYYDPNMAARIFNYCKKSNYCAYLKEDEKREELNNENNNDKTKE